MKVSVKNITDIATKHGFVGAGFKPAQGVSGTNQVNFRRRAGLKPAPTKTCGFFIVRGVAMDVMKVSVKEQ